MLKYVFGFILVFSLAVYVAIQDEHTAQQSAQEGKQSSSPVVAAVPDSNHPQQNKPNPVRNLPSWYGFFRWPNGTTTWAILLTLLAIAEQTRLLKEYVVATKDGVRAANKSADAALLNAQAVINSERAWIKVTPHVESLKFFPLREKDAPIPDDLVDVLPIAHQFPAKLVNVGKTPAKIEASAIRYIRTATHPSQWDEVPDYGELSKFEMYAFPDDILTLTGQLSPVATMTKSQIEAVKDGIEFLFAFGIIKYRDVYGNPHETKFGYLYETQIQHLVMKDNVIHTIRTGEARFQTSGPPKYNGHT